MCHAAILHPMSKASRSDHDLPNPKGALRITPPQPFESFMRSIGVPCAPAGWPINRCYQALVGTRAVCRYKSPLAIPKPDFWWRLC
ncbi:MAG: hypothetical protein CM1200mP4_5100 [Rhodospirillaceae bacterium]|nr:MAG: hypothetical protein CM1200mP4_5100 [Rhodospirillaceae bacterium]